jgi:CRP-like cAMP-binding protein
MTIRDFFENGALTGEKATLDCGKSLFTQGEEARYFYLILEGSIALVDLPKGMDEQAIAPPDFMLGITDLVNEQYSFTAYTLTDTTFIKLERTAIKQAIKQNPLLRLYLLKQMSWEAKRTNIIFE